MPKKNDIPCDLYDVSYVLFPINFSNQVNAGFFLKNLPSILNSDKDHFFSCFKSIKSLEMCLLMKCICDSRKYLHVLVCFLLLMSIQTFPSLFDTSILVVITSFFFSLNILLISINVYDNIQRMSKVVKFR